MNTSRAKRSRIRSTARAAVTRAAVEALERRVYLTGTIPLLSQTTTYFSDSIPKSIVSVDVNGDGRPDLVAAAGNGNIIIFQANGNGTFEYSQAISDGLGQDTNYSVEIAVAHLEPTEPTIPDLILVNGTVHASVMIGLGDGQFQAPQLMTTSSAVTAVAVGDLTGDGDQDVVFGYTDGDIATRLGAGNGNLGGPVGQQNVATGPITSITLGDFNNDGTQDIAVAASGGALYDLLGQGDGTFAGPTTLITPAGIAISVAAGDFNGDGNIDLAVAESPGSVAVLAGAGNGTFAVPQSFSVPAGASSIAVADINGDGKQDLVIGNATQNTVSVALGKGDGTFRSNLRSYYAGVHPLGITVGDFTGDGKPSIAAADYTQPGISVLVDVSPGLFFNTPYSLAIGQTNRAVTAAQLTGSGHTDLVSVSRDQNTVSILLGDGNGAFEEPEVYSVATDPTAVVVSDLGNGHPDIIVFSPNDGQYNFTVLLGNGDGSFQTPMEFTAPLGSFGPNTFAVGDLNGDGIPDMVVAGGPRDGYINVLIGNGNGTFKAPVLYSTLGTNPQAVAIGNLGNGFEDIVVADLDDGTPHGDVQVFMNNGDGTFKAPTTQYPVGNLPYSIALADLNGDNKLDVVTTNAENNNVSVLLGNGDGSFGATQTFPTGNFPTSVAVADFNNDGHADLVVSDQSQNAESVLVGNGDGTFAPPVTLPVGDDPESVTVGDFNGDGRPDIVAADGINDNLNILLNGSSSLAFSPTPPVMSSNSPSGVAAGDLTNNGRTDLVAVERESKDVEVFLANGDGSFKTPEIYSISNYPTFVALEDVNGDGIPDIVAASGQEGSINVLLGNGNGSFKPEIVTTLGAGFSSGPDTVAFADFNGDGKLDVVVAVQDQLDVLLGNGDGTFGPPSIYAPEGDGGSTIFYGVATGDLNGDGLPDIVATAQYSIQADPLGEMDVLLNQGNGRFGGFSGYYTVGSNPDSVAVAHINGGPNLDVIVASSSRTGTVSVFLGNGDGSFGPPATIDAGPYPVGIAVGDLNGDGLPDIAVANDINPGSTVSVLLGNNMPGEAPFDAPLAFGVGGAPIGLVIADFNGDGGNDIVTANNQGYSLSVLLNATPRSPAIVTPNNVTFESGAVSRVNVQAVGLPTATFTESGALPGGVTFQDNGNDTASIFGTPTAAAGGVYVLTLTATNGVQVAGSQIFTVTVDQGPLFTSSNTAKFTTGTSGGFTISASGFPLPSLGESGALPTGITFINNGNGTASLSGTPATQTPGNYVITLTANNGVGNAATQTFTLILDQAPSFAAASNTAFSAGAPNSFIIGTMAFPTAALTETGPLPAGVSFIDNGNGTATLSGTPGANSGGVYSLTLTANNGISPPATEVFTLGVVQPPTFTSAGSATFVTATGGSFTVTTSGFPAASLSETPSLPPGLVFTNNGDGTGTISGMTTAPGGDFALTLTANNGTGNAVNQSFTLILDQPPAFVGGTAATFVAGTLGSFMIGTTGFPIASLTKKGKLPSGVTFHDNGNGTATISGAAAALTGGVYNLTITATNGVTTPATELFTLTENQAPAFTSSSTAAFATSSSGTFAITTMGPPSSSLTESGTLPAGLTYTDNGNGSAAISGTATAGTDGTYTLTITASNGIAPIATQSLSVVVQTATITMGGDGTVTAMGTDASGTTAVTYSGGMVGITIDGQSQTFAVTNVSTVNVGLGDGNDSVAIGSNVPLALMIVGGAGDDTITAMNSMPDTIDGVAGNNSISAGNGVDMLSGGTGNDSISGGGAGSEIMGGPGSDAVNPISMNETVRGGQGNDTVVGDPQGDSLRGGPGNDIFVNGSGAGDIIDGGLGLNFAQNNPNDAIFNVYEVFDPTPPPPGTALSAEGRVVPETGGVTAVVSGEILKIVGTSGDDSIGLSSDGSQITVDSGGSSIGSFAVSALSGIHLHSGGGDDTVNIDSSVLLSATVNGGAGNDSLAGGGGDNVLIGGAGNDTLVGGGGTNLLVPGDQSFDGFTGSDSLEGGSGYTIADFSHRTDPLSLSNDGTDDSGDAGAGETTTIAADVSAIWGGVAADTIVGTTAGEFLSGGSGPDSIHGGGVSDVLVGGVGKDTVAVAAEPVSLFLRDGKVDQYSGVTDPDIDILQLDSNDRLTS